MIRKEKATVEARTQIKLVEIKEERNIKFKLFLEISKSQTHVT